MESTQFMDMFIHIISQITQQDDITNQHPIYKLSAVLSILFGAFVVFYIMRAILQSKMLLRLFENEYRWDNALLEHGFFNRVGHVMPAVFILLITPVLLEQNTLISSFTNKAALVYIVFAGIFAIYALLNTIEDLYNASKLASKAPITGFIQVFKLLFAIIAIVLSISLILEKSPYLLLSGLTAITAILLLIFRDTILGFVAGIQIAANRMFNSGDWIEIPKFGIDGEIQQIGLNVVKVQNWDKTIATIPTYSLTNESVRNWQGMQRSGGRRIKRALLIDQSSIGFLSDDQLDDLKQFKRIAQYLADKLGEINIDNINNAIDAKDTKNARRLTNIGTFRAYIEAYLKSHPNIAQQMTLMVRQLKPTETGLPIELYCFTNTTIWVEYESIQADIFDHLLAIMPLFGLRCYQRVSDKG